MRPPALVLLDIDGCLLPRREEATDGTALDRFRVLSRLVPLGFCTGRPQPFVDALSRVYSLTAPSICEWGGTIFFPDSYRTITSPLLSPALLARLRQAEGALCDLGLNLQQKTTAIVVYCDADHPVSDLNQLVCSALADARLDGSVSVAVFADHIDVRPKAVSKATGLQWLMEMTGIAAADVLAVGDDETDLDVFAIAGQSAAPSNASEVVKAAAGFVSSESYTDGVCEILEEIAVLSRP